MTAPPVETHNLSTAEELLDAVSPRSRFFVEPTDWMFRGQGDSTRDLLPNALRKDAKLSFHGAAPPNTQTEQIRQEHMLLWDFYRAADAQGLPIPEDGQHLRSSNGWQVHLEASLDEIYSGREAWPPYEFLSMAALAQHYGIPTRLLDWTVKPLTGAYFAAKSAAAKHKSNPSAGTFGVWGINRQYLYERWPNTPADDVLVVTAPRASNQNLHAQGGVFTVDRFRGDPHETIWHTNPDNLPVLRTNLDELIRLTAEIPDGSTLSFPVMHHWIVPNSEAPKLLRYLNDHGVNASHVFPGFDGVVQSLKERVLWDKVSAFNSFL